MLFLENIDSLKNSFVFPDFSSFQQKRDAQIVKKAQKEKQTLLLQGIAVATRLVRCLIRAWVSINLKFFSVFFPTI